MHERLEIIGDPNLLPPPILEPFTPEKAEFAFTLKQKRYFHERDEETCQAKRIVPHQETEKKHVHHVLPQGVAKKLKVDPDIPNNGLLICENAHRKIHPDMDKFLKGYHTGGDKDFTKVVQERKDKLDERVLYHDPTWDRQLFTRTIQQEDKAKKKGLKWPDRKNGK